MHNITVNAEKVQLELRTVGNFSRPPSTNAESSPARTEPGPERHVPHTTIHVRWPTISGCILRVRYIRASGGGGGGGS